MFSHFRIMFTISYTTTVTLHVAKHVLNTTFELVNGGRPFATWYKENIIFGKESFTNAKKVLNFILNLKNEKKVVKSLSTFQTYLFVFICIFICMSVILIKLKNISVWVFFCKLAAYFQNSSLEEYFWGTTFDELFLWYGWPTKGV